MIAGRTGRKRLLVAAAFGGFTNVQVAFSRWLGRRGSPEHIAALVGSTCRRVGGLD